MPLILPVAFASPPRSAADGPRRAHGWTALPEAAALLADCAAHPPRTRMVKVVDLTTFYRRDHVGGRVRRLYAIHRAEGARLFAAAQAAGDYAAFAAHCRRTVQQAISDAVFHAALARSADCDARALAALEAQAEKEWGAKPPGLLAPHGEGATHS